MTYMSGEGYDVETYLVFKRVQLDKSLAGILARSQSTALAFLSNSLSLLINVGLILTKLRLFQHFSTSQNSISTFFVNKINFLASVAGILARSQSSALNCFPF